MRFSEDWFEDEVREGFYVPGIIKRYWAAALEILEIIDGICRKHNIRWFAMYGTLLGAARHQGFVPWDDDVDVCMLREDFDSFLAAAKDELPEGFSIESFATDRDETVNGFSPGVSIRNYPRLYHSEPEVLRRFHGFPYQALIDVFPLDNISPDTKRENYRDIIWIEINEIARMYTGHEFSEDMEDAISRVEGILNVSEDGAEQGLSFRERLQRFQMKACTLFQNEETGIVGNVPNFISYNASFPIEFFSQTDRLPFEQFSIPVPWKYRGVLRSIYGNWELKTRGGTIHSYPYFSIASERLGKHMRPSHLFPYEIKGEDIKKSLEAQKLLSPAEWARSSLSALKSAVLSLSAAFSSLEKAAAAGMLADFQQVAVGIGTGLEQSGLEEAPGLVSMLETFADHLYQLYEYIAADNSAAEKETVRAHGADDGGPAMLAVLREDLDSMLEFAGTRLWKKKEVVFLPRRASDWAAMESVFSAAMEDEEWKVSVIPVPWYYRDVDGTMLQEKWYDGGLFPDYVPITGYRDYAFSLRHPDVIITQNPYDEYNNAMSVHPAFYIRELRKHTECLVYIPWFVTEELDGRQKNDPAARNAVYYVTTPGVVLSDLVIVQSDNMKKFYVDVLSDAAGEESRSLWEEKVQGLGSPLSDKEGGGRAYGNAAASSLWEAIRKKAEDGKSREGKADI